MSKNNKHDIELLQLVCFQIENELFAIDIQQVKEIIKLKNLTNIPSSPEFVEGIIDLRETVISVVDLRALLGLSRKDYDNETRIIVIEKEENTVGFIVDKVEEVLRISSDNIEPPPDILAAINSEYITSICKLEDKLIILLDLEKILSVSQMNALKALV